MKLVGCLTTHKSCLTCRHYNLKSDPCMNQVDVCPDCIERLVEDKKKLGERTDWKICPKCGYRTSPEITSRDIEIAEKWVKEVKENGQGTSNKENY